jgi:hypothetical protein
VAAKAKAEGTTIRPGLVYEVRRTAKEVVEDRKAAGIKFDASYVYNVRGADKRAGREVMRTAARRPTERTAPPSWLLSPSARYAARR